MNTHVIDQEARDLARNAIAQINAHEDVCGERWREARNFMRDIKAILAWGISGLIVTMASLIGWLATHPPG